MLVGAIEKDNRCLKQTVKGYFHDWYYTCHDPRTRIGYVIILKNDYPPRTHQEICESMKRLRRVLAADFAQIVRDNAGRTLTVCGVPRAKAERTYDKWQTGLKRTFSRAVKDNSELRDGLDFIVREKDTRTTHRERSGHGGNGELPRPGLIRDTCWLSPEIKGRDILLVDDIYTPGVGIDEDAVQTLLDSGARSVVFYAVGYTANRLATKLTELPVAD